MKRFLWFILFTITIVSCKNEEPYSRKGNIFTVNGVSFEMIPVEGGIFTMGATSEQGGDNDEQPTHKVTLSNYLIGKTEVTQALWTAVMGYNPSRFKGDNLPVENVNWDNCQEFIGRLNQLSGLKFRLPTEAEWEYAASGGNKSMGYHYSGSNNIDEIVWYTSNANNRTHDVATKRPNELGIYDMTGNVWEWCVDCYGNYTANPVINPLGPIMGAMRVRRGGSWYSNAMDCRVSGRDYCNIKSMGGDLGFRLVLDEDDTLPFELYSEENIASTEIDFLDTVTIISSSTSQDFIVRGVSFSMVRVEGGTFTMGATDEQGSDAYNNEYPIHQVTLSNYFIGKTEVTQELWNAIMGSNLSYFQGDNLPVENVSWNDCQQFIAKLNQITGKTFRLPTEAEWEFAARGGNKSEGYKYAGSNNIEEIAWYTNNSNEETHPVGSKRPNELGIYDMSGNVWEWCQDWYGIYAESAQINPQGLYSGDIKVYRGGSWYCFAPYCRVSCRGGNNSIYYKDNGLGFRLAMNE